MPKKFEIQSNHGEEGKKFQITKRTKFQIENISRESQTQNKKFEIQPDNTQPTKKFEIKGTSQDNSENRSTERWFKQNNLSDCGPLAILNILSRIGFENGPTNVQQIRDAVALRRIRGNETTISTRGSQNTSERDITRLGWLTSIDLWLYLQQDLGITSEPVSNITDIERVKQILNNNPHKFFISSYGSHFKVFRKIVGTDNFEILDSFNDGPEIATREEVFRFLDQSIGTTGVLAG